MSQSPRTAKPVVILTQSEYDRLAMLADGASARDAAAASDLSVEIERARVVPDGKVPRGVVRMGSVVEYSDGSGERRTVELVFPGEADIARGRVSILTPIGAALIGMAEGRSIDWTGRDGRVRRLTVHRVGEAAHG